MKSTYRLPEMRDLPKSDQEIEHSKTCDSTAHPARRNGLLQSLHSSLMRCIDEKVVITPVAQAKSALRNPRQESEHDAHFQAKEDIEKYS